MRVRPSCPLPQSKEARPCRAIQRTEPPPPMTLQEAQAEASRCLSLSSCEGCEVCQLVCPDQAILKDPVTHRLEIDLRYCKGCGLCAHLCPKGAIIMVLEKQSD